MGLMEYPEGATPLTPEELDGLRLPHISTRSELDRWEQENILEAESWVARLKRRALLEEAFLLELHRRMFGKVWTWVGRFRTTGKSIGVPVWDIGPKLRGLCQDMEMWRKVEAYPPDEACARFHHRLVSIHPFANGNGRHARLMVDLLLEKLYGRPRFSWGSGILGQPGACRSQYIAALRAADGRDLSPLLAFVRA